MSRLNGLWYAWPVLVACCAAAGAAPQVTNVSGGLEHGKSGVARGAGFGARGDFNSDAGKIVHVFDDFNDGEISSNAYASWTVYNKDGGGVLISRNGPRTLIKGDSFYRRGPEGLGFLSVAAGNRQEYYASFYMRLSPAFNITSAPGTEQFKIIRLYSANGNVNVYPCIGGADGFFMSMENSPVDYLRHQLQMESVPDRPEGWHKMAVYVKKNSSSGARDGKLRVWWDNNLVWDWQSHHASNPSFGVMGDADYGNGDLAGDWAVGNYFSSASPATYVDFDDVLLDHTQARVELGNAATYSECSILEVQPAATWSDNAVSFTVNAGALAQAPAAYLYVVDAQGAANLSGFPVKVSASLDARLTATDEDMRPPQKFLIVGSPAPEKGSVQFGPAATEIVIYDATGLRVYEAAQAGNLPLVWDGKDLSGRALDSGAYICKIKGTAGRVIYHSVAIVR